MSFIEEADKFRYVLWTLTILFTIAVVFGPSEGTLGLTGRLLLGLFSTLLVIYLIVKAVHNYNYKKWLKEHHPDQLD